MRLSKIEYTVVRAWTRCWLTEVAAVSWPLRVRAIGPTQITSGITVPPGLVRRANGKKQKRSTVEHFVPAIRVPDGKADGCMRCGKPFCWRRRRHHCRLCGRCVCADCSRKVSLNAHKAFKMKGQMALLEYFFLHS